MHTSDSTRITIVLGLDQSREAIKSLLGRLYAPFDPNAIWDYLLEAMNPRGNRTASELRSITLGAPDCEIAATDGTLALDWNSGDIRDGKFRGLLTIDSDGEHFRFTNGQTGETLTFFRAKAPGARVAKSYAALSTTTDRVAQRLPRLRQASGTLFARGSGELEAKTGSEILEAISGDTSETPDDPQLATDGDEQPVGEREAVGTV